MNIIAYYKGYHIDVPSEAPALEIEAAKATVDALNEMGFKCSWNPETAKQALAPETPAVAPVVASPTSQTPFCGIHGTPMVLRSGTYKADVMAKDGKSVWKKAGEAYQFWACPTKNADQSYCRFKVKDVPVSKDPEPYSTDYEEVTDRSYFGDGK